MHQESEIIRSASSQRDGAPSGEKTDRPSGTRLAPRHTPRVPAAPEALDAYLAELGKAKPLARRDELALALQIEQARVDAFDALLESGAALPAVDTLVSDVDEGGESLTKVLEVESVTSELLAQWVSLVELEAQFQRINERLRSRKVTGKARRELRAARRANRERRNELVRALPLRRDARRDMMAAFDAALAPLVRADAELATVSDDLGMSERAIREAYRATPEAELDDELDGARLSLRSSHQQIRDVERALGCSRVALRAAAAKVLDAHRREKNAKRKLTTANLRLVVAFARKYRGRGVPLGDLIQEGNMGLMTAVEKYDHRAGTKFSTYASWWLRQSMQRAVINQGTTVRMPIHVAVSSSLTDRTRQKMAQRLGREPDDTELAAQLGVSTADLERRRAPRSTSVSLQQPIGEDGRMELGEVLADVDASDPQLDMILSDRKEHARRALAVLTPREQLVVTMRFGLDRRRGSTLREIGEVLGCTRERVRQIEAKALKRLRQAMLAIRL